MRFLAAAYSIVLLLLCSKSTIAQQSGQRVSGNILDSATKKEIPYASVSLLQKDLLILGTTSDSSGNFEFLKVNPGKYKLDLTINGYRKYSQTVTVSAGKDIVLLPIELKADNTTLAQVTITQLKSLVEDKGDRLVYNAEKDITNAGGTAADLLRKVPMLTVDLNGNVQMMGNSNIKVLINGKPSSMMARNLADALRQMPASAIKSVEVISSPGAKYDAEGAGGVINIITKKGLQGANGTLNATIGDFNKGIGSSFTYKKKKISLNLSANIYQYRNKFSREEHRTTFSDGQPATFLDQQSYADNTGSGANGELSFDYDPDSLNRVNFSANIWGGNFPSNSLNETTLSDKNENVVQHFTNDTRFRNPFGNGQLDLGYTRTFKQPGKEFSFLMQFSRMPDNYFYDSYFDYANGIKRRQYSENYSRNKEYTIQADYTHPFKVSGKKDTADVKLEMGTKVIYRDVGSEFYISGSSDFIAPLVVDSSQTDVFEYTQGVYSAYTNLRIETKKKWTINTGVRFERTTLQGDFQSTQTGINTAFNNIIPSISISKTIKKHTLKFNYTQRIRRPMIWNLNPWRNESDPNNVFTGNPYLFPELNHAWEIGHSVSGEKSLSLNSNIYLRHTKSGIQYLTRIEGDGKAVTSPQNIGKRHVFGANVNFSLQPNKDWNVSSGAEVSYLDLEATGSVLENSGWVYRFNFNASYKLPKDYTIQANGNYNTGWISLQVNNSPWYWYGISGKKEFWDKKGSLTLGLNNPFNRKTMQTAHRFDRTFVEESKFFGFNRSVRLTFEWKFGQMGTEGKKSKKIANDDTGR